MSDNITKRVGLGTAYGFAKAGGYEGTVAEFTELLGNIAIDLARIENLSVTVTTLPAGSQATASLNGSVLSLGIPKGDKGDKGNTGNTPDFGIGTVTTLSAGSSATASITGTAENPVLNLGIPEGQAGSGAVGTVASAYSASKTYAVGDYVIHNSNLYRCTTAITTAESFTAAHWTQVALADDVSDLKSNIDEFFNPIWTTGKYINGNGQETSNGNFKCTDYIELGDVLFGIKYSLFQQSNTNIVSYYDADKVYISGVKGTDNNIAKTGEVSYPSNAKYVRFSTCIASAGITNPEPIVRITDLVKNTKLGTNSVNANNMINGSVTMDKCNFIIHDPESNYIDKTKLSSGYINASGAFVSNDSWTATDYCKLSPNTQYYSNGLHGGYCAFYKADKTVIAAYGVYSYTVSSFTTPAETAYARFSTNIADTDAIWLFTKNEKPKDYSYILDGVGIDTTAEISRCDYNGDEISVFNKILCVGDSLTEGTFNHLDSGTTQYVSYSDYAYPKYLQKITGVDVTNLGHGGQTSVQWYSTEQNSDLSGYDCAIIQLGVNDCGTYVTLGDATKTAFSNIITKLKTQNKNIKIFVANIIPATSYSSSDYIAFSDALLEWLEETYASDSSVIPLDMQQYGNTGKSPAYNCGHLSAFGYNRLAMDYKGYISWYISQNKTDFREVQFIGTDYWYTNPNS